MLSLILQRDVPEQGVQSKDEVSNHKCSVVSQTLFRSKSFAQKAEREKYSVPYSHSKMSAGGGNKDGQDETVETEEKTPPWGGRLEVLSSARGEVIILPFLRKGADSFFPPVLRPLVSAIGRRDGRVFR